MGIFTASDKTKVKKLKEDGCVVCLQVEIPAAKVQEATQNAFVRIQGQARVPGFRAGKAPLDVIQKQYAGHARERAIDELVREALPNVLKEQNLKPVSTPTLDSVKMDAGQPLVFELTVETTPQFAPKNYKKLPASRKKYVPTDAEVAEKLAELQEGNARLETAKEEAVAKPHYVVLDYQGTQDGKPVKNLKGTDVLFDMSAPNAIEGLADGLVGAKRSETRAVKTKLGDKETIINATVKEIKSKVLPKLDDEFAKDVGAQSLDELKTNIKKMLEEEGRRRSERELMQQIEEGLLKNNPFPVPPSLVDAELDRMLERLRRQVLGARKGFPEAELAKLREQFKPKAEAEIRLSFLMQSIAAAEKIEATKEELEAELGKNLESAQSDNEKNEIRKLFSEREGDIAGMLRERKVMDFLKGSAVISES